MLTVDDAFRRIAMALRDIGYRQLDSGAHPEAPDGRMAQFVSPDMSIRLLWNGKERVLILQVEAEGEWVEFARRQVGEGGLETAAVDSLVRAVRNEVDETSTDGP
jgi:hypothetical protein